ncbi:MAG: InlB B-repeat-containing protein [Firmicutes bacterium]|nr:InlB B-repeat-containing protein [Bacillota bacterium]
MQYEKEKKVKKIVSWGVSICILIGCMIPCAMAASNDYTTWRQSDSAWNQSVAWPASQYPAATMRYMREAGCLVTSIAMLLRHYNVVTDSNVNNFNPWKCNEALKSAGAFNSAADLIWGSISKAYPGFQYAGNAGYSASTLYDLYSRGYACIVAVNGYGHYVAVKSATSSASVIMDPGWGYSSLSSFRSVNQIYYFSVKGAPSNASKINFDPCGGSCDTKYIIKSFGDIYGTLPTPKREGYKFDGWYSEKNGKGSKYTSDMKYWGNREEVTWYANWKVDGSKINFDPCGGSCDTKYIIRSFGDVYGTLPTPKREGYKFDGWYSEKNGKGSKYTSDMKYWGDREEITWYANWKAQDESDAETPISPSVSVHFPKVSVYVQGQFTDVPAAQWFTQNVAGAVEFGLMKGNTASTFNPYGDVTLAETITMAARIHSIYTTGAESFDQSVGDVWYQVYLNYAYQNGIIGYSLYSGNVQEKATRAQYAEIFANALPDEALAAKNSVPDAAIPDVTMQDSYAGAVYKLYRAGILAGGDANGTFSPLTYITRAESATVVARMADSDNRMSFSL